MSCSNPLTAYRLASGGIKFSLKHGDDSTGVIFAPCRQCAMCRQTMALHWATRLVAEGYAHKHSICACLTYDDAHLTPRGTTGSVCLRDVQLFLKRLRFDLKKRYGIEIRFDVNAEYSPRMLRPHYHLALFGWWPADARPAGKSQAGNPEFESEILSRAWGKGRVTFQEWSSGAASYIARHNAWKATGQLAPVGDLVNGAGDVVGCRAPEFHRSSRRPGIGAAYVDRYGSQLAGGFIVVNGRKCEAIPPYLLDRWELADPVRAAALRESIELRARSRMGDETRDRLRAREGCAAAAFARARRDGVE